MHLDSLSTLVFQRFTDGGLGSRHDLEIIAMQLVERTLGDDCHRRVTRFAAETAIFRCKKLAWFRQSDSGIEAVANPGLREYVARRTGIGLDLLSELADEHAQVLGLLAVVCSPDSAE